MKIDWKWSLLFLAAIGFFAIRGQILQGKVNNLSDSLAFQTDSLIHLDSAMSMIKAHDHLTSDQKDSIADELKQVKKLNATLVATANLHLTPRPVKHDTVTVHDSITADSTRIAEVNDTTEAGVLNAHIVAPPFPERIAFSYEFQPSPLDVSVTLARTKGNTAFFLFKYRGGETEVSTSYAKLPKPDPRFEWYLQGGKFITSTDYELGAGADLRAFWGIHLVGEALQKFNPSVSDSLTGFRAKIILRKVF